MIIKTKEGNNMCCCQELLSSFTAAVNQHVFHKLHIAYIKWEVVARVSYNEAVTVNQNFASATYRLGSSTITLRKHTGAMSYTLKNNKIAVSNK